CHDDVFDTEHRGRLVEHFVRLVDAFLEDPLQPVDRVTLLSPEERAHLIGGLNQTGVADPEGETVVNLFERRAAQHPERVAVESAGLAVTYKELNASATRLADRLCKLGVGLEARVAVYLERSAAVIPALFGIWKAGGVYVPLDVGYPAERVRFML